MIHKEFKPHLVRIFEIRVLLFLVPEVKVLLVAGLVLLDVLAQMFKEGGHPEVWE